ncbi:rhomboid family intramembrane serine protease [Flavobacterium sp.]|uniref:rhomboid family intramembrane serine protease n=1 Tax=Flavobacterium sp. TaxID=239 RepID=UPI003BED48A0
MIHNNEFNHFRFSASTWIVPTFMLLFVWFVFYADNLFHLHLNEHGILPRTAFGLQGVFFSPFLHGDINHIASNSLPLFILTTALIYFYREVSLKVLVFGILLSGIITWIIGRESYHIGASSLIYVLVSFIFFKGMMTQYYRLMALSLVVVVLYGGMIWYIFPEVDNAISWEGHLAGLVTGFVFAVKFKTPDYVKDIQYDWEKPDFNPQEDPFMRRFDDNGNFVNLPKPEEIEVINEELVSQPIQYVYVFKEKNEDELEQ